MIKKRKEFLSWLDEMEFDVLGLPKPDAIFYLEVPVSVSQKLVHKKTNQTSKKYLKNKKDLHESNIDFQKKAKKSAMRMIKESNNWIKIDCLKGGDLLSKEEIHQIILQKLNHI